MNPALVTVTRTDPVSAFDGEAAANSMTAAIRANEPHLIARRIPDMIVSQIIKTSERANLTPRCMSFQDHHQSN
jgi:hypothetical protein